MFLLTAFTVVATIVLAYILVCLIKAQRPKIKIKILSPINDQSNLIDDADEISSVGENAIKTIDITSIV